MADGSIAFNASLNTGGFRSGAADLKSIASSASSAVANHFGKIATAVAGIGAAFLGVRAAVEAFNSAIAMGGELNELAARTGETAGNLAVLQRAFQNAGAGADSVGPTINRLQRAIVEAGQGSKEQAEAFAVLGLNMGELKNMTPTEQLQAVGDALARVSNDSDRSALAMQLLGRGGGELVPLLRAMGIELDVARRQLGSTPEVMDRVSAVLDTVGDNFAAIGQKGKEFAAGLLERMAPALADITDKLASIDAAGFGQAVSAYIEKTLQWFNATLGLTSALDNLRTAIAGITSGSFGEGLSLIFLTARDTAFNAINQIVAAAFAAVSTVANVLRELFNPNSTTMAFIAGAFNMLGAKIAAGIFGSLATVLEKIPFMGAAAEAVRAAKSEAEQAATDIANIMYYEADNLKAEWAAVFGDAPKTFRESYDQNMRDPLIDMVERTKETAAQAEKVAAATRAASFDAKSYAAAMRGAREDMLSGGPISPFGSPVDMTANPDGRNFPWQGDGPSGPPIVVPPPQPKETATFGKSDKPEKPSTALDQLRDLAKNNVNSRANELRIDARAQAAMNRARELESRGMYNSASRAEERARKNAERMAAAYLEKEQQKMADAAAKPEAQRQAEAAAAAQGSSGSIADPTAEILNWLKNTFFKDFQERLPQNALT